MRAALLISSFALCVTATASAQTPEARDIASEVAALLQIAAGEYELAISDEEIIDSLEYEETLLLFGQARELAAALQAVSSHGHRLAVALDSAEARIARVAVADHVGAALDEVQQVLAEDWGVALVPTPARAPSPRRGASLYRAHCTACHGPDGRGDGPANPMDPPPTDFTDPTLAMEPARAFQVITYGIPGTRMSGWRAQLDEGERWDLAAYVRSLSAPDRKGRVASQSAEIGAFEFILLELERAIERNEAADYGSARRVALQAYMSFELMEPELRVRAPELTRQLEGEFLRFREAVGSETGDARAVHTRLKNGLGVAHGQLQRETTALSAFVSSMVIIVREGVEAVLIIAALLAFLVRSGNAGHRKPVYWGATAAIGLSLITALAFELIFGVAPASQEMLEGVTMLIAVVVLFSVSYWLISKLEYRHWERYIRTKVQLALSKRSRFALASVAFLAVYREGFETVLFYEALLGTTGSGAAVLGGFTLGLISLTILCLLIIRSGVRIPLRPFFALTSAVLYYMAFVFAGQGIRELQEAGVVGIRWVAGAPRLDILGVYPTLEGLVVQGLLVLAVVFALAWTFVIAPARTQTAPSAPTSA